MIVILKPNAAPEKVQELKEQLQNQGLEIHSSTGPVSYTHLDVYKRQRSESHPTPNRRPPSPWPPSPGG